MSGEGFIKTPKQLIIAGVVALVTPVVLALMTAYLVASSKRIDPNESPASVEQRIRPIGELVRAGDLTPAAAVAPPVAAVAQSARSGEEVYRLACAACHEAGVAGAPKTGDKAAWAARIAQGMAVLYKHSIEGFKGMPARGGNSSLSDEEVKAAVDYQVARSR
ncbi:MAG: c-type cytochrome [Casimicrobiaceae bacterium]|nr:c-type cytochrome [Casimicrobiaceae bacterium]